jgi:hypothetical protein
LEESDLRPYTVDELESKFHEKYPYFTSSRYSRILKERYDEIVESINSEMRTRAEEYKQNPFGFPAMQRHSLRAVLFDKDLSDKEVETRDRTEEKIQMESNEISILENLKHEYENELRAISYPLYGIGFLSQVVFVITGIVIPLNYEWWVPTILFSPIDPNLFGLIMFYIGISSSFSYIGLELWHSLYKKNKKIDCTKETDPMNGPMNGV